MTPSHSTWHMALATSLVLGLGACGGGSGGGSDDDDDNGDGGGTIDAEADEGIRVVHAALDGPSLDLYIDGEQVNDESIGYASGAGYFADEDEPWSGDVDIEAVEHDGEPGADTVASATATLEEGDRVTAVVNGESGDMAMEVIDEGDASGTEARISHFAQDLGNVDVYLPQGGETSQSPADLTPLATGVSAGDIGNWQAIEDGADTRLWLTPAGEDEIIFDSGQPGLSNPLRADTGSQVHLILVSLTPADFANERNFSEFGGVGMLEHPLGPEAERVVDQRARLQVINAIDDVDAINVSIDDGDEASAENIAYGEGSELLEVTPVPEAESLVSGSRQFTITDASDDTVLYEGESSVTGDSLEAGNHETHVVAGSQAEDTIQMASGSRQWMAPSSDVIAFQGAYVFYGYDGTANQVDLVFDGEDGLAATEIAYMEVAANNLGGGLGMMPEQDPVPVAFNESSTGNEIATEDFEVGTDLETGKIYTFVLAGTSSGGTANADLFHVEAPWEGIPVE